MAGKNRGFWNLVTKKSDDECWLFQGSVTAEGYGIFCGIKAHRYSYKYFVGEISREIALHHTCKNKLCVNPKHLEPMSAKAHYVISPGGAAGANSKKTHCKYGHPLSGGNLYLVPGGGRACKECRRKFTAASKGYLKVR